MTKSQGTEHGDVFLALGADQLFFSGCRCRFRVRAMGLKNVLGVGVNSSSSTKGPKLRSEKLDFDLLRAWSKPVELVK